MSFTLEENAKINAANYPIRIDGGSVKLFPAFSIALSAFLMACPAPQEDQNPGPAGPGPAGPALNGPQGGLTGEGAPQPGEPNQDVPDAGEQADPPGSVGEEVDAAVSSPVKGHVEDFGVSQKGAPEAVGEGDLLVLSPMRKQEDIQGGAHFTLSGTVSGICEGKLRIDVLSQTPVSGEAGKVGPLTALEMAALGVFSIYIPEGDTVELSAICDANGDDRVGAGDSLSAPLAAAGLGANKSGIALVLVPLSSVPNPEEGGKEQD